MKPALDRTMLFVGLLFMLAGMGFFLISMTHFIWTNQPKTCPCAERPETP